MVTVVCRVLCFKAHLSLLLFSRQLQLLTWWDMLPLIVNIIELAFRTVIMLLCFCRLVVIISGVLSFMAAEKFRSPSCIAIVR